MRHVNLTIRISKYDVLLAYIISTQELALYIYYIKITYYLYLSLLRYLDLSPTFCLLYIRIQYLHRAPFGKGVVRYLRCIVALATRPLYNPKSVAPILPFPSCLISII